MKNGIFKTFSSVLKKNDKEQTSEREKTFQEQPEQGEFGQALSGQGQLAQEQAGQNEIESPNILNETGEEKRNGLAASRHTKEKRNLFFIGHYDFLLPALLYRSRLVDAECESDFIVLLTKNSKRTCRFIREKCVDGQTLGRFASVRDERFLGKRSPEATEQSIVAGYDKIFETFGSTLASYDRIYMSFDEWNSFGIYLALAGVATPVTVLVRDPEQLQKDIYAYLDGRGRCFFSNLQRQYRVLNADTGFTQEILALHNPGGQRDVDGIPVVEFDYETVLERLDDGQKARLLEFFAVKCEKEVPVDMENGSVVEALADMENGSAVEQSADMENGSVVEQPVNMANGSVVEAPADMENGSVVEQPKEYEYLPLDEFLKKKYGRVHEKALMNIYKQELKEKERSEAERRALENSEETSESIACDALENSGAASESTAYNVLENDKAAEDNEGAVRKRENTIRRAVAENARTERMLVIADSFWFRNQCPSAEYDYIRDYQLLLNAFGDGTSPVVIKEHPRMYLPGRRLRRAFSYGVTIPGYVPAELLYLCEDIRWKQVISVGLPIPRTVAAAAKETRLVRNSYFAFAHLWMRLDASVQMAKQLGFSKVLCRGISEDDLYNYRTFFDASDVELVAVPELESYIEMGENGDEAVHSVANIFPTVKNAFVVCAGLHKEDYFRMVFPLMADNVVAVLDPETAFAFLDRDAYDEVKDWLYAWRMKKERLFMNDFYNRYEDVWYVFSGQEQMREPLRTFAYRRTLPYAGYEVYALESLSSKQLLKKLPDKPESKAYISRKAMTRPVIIYGASEIAVHFLQEYGKNLNVRYVMKDKGKRTDRRLLRNYKVVKFNPARIHKGDYIIVAQSFIHNIDRLPDYAVTRDKLLRMGYRVCRQFAYYRLFDAAEKRKEIILFCGYCEMSGIKQVLELTSANRDYCMLFYHIGRETMRTAPGYRDFIASAKLCDILVHAPLTVRKGVLDADVTKLISERTQTIFISQISFRGYAPYKDMKFTRRNYALRLFGTIYYPFLYEVPILNGLIQEGRTNEEIYETVASPDLYTKAQVERNAMLALRILQIMDSKSDISIYDYVRENYKKKMLFKDCIHADEDLFFEYARRLSWYLNKPYVAEIDEAQRICEENGVRFQVATEEPIFPSVAKHLGLAFAENRKYMMKISEEHIRFVDFKEWIYEYCDYYRAALHVRRVLNPRYNTEQVTILRNELRKYSIRPYLPEPEGDTVLGDDGKAALLAQWADYGEEPDDGESMNEIDEVEE